MVVGLLGSSGKRLELKLTIHYPLHMANTLDEKDQNRVLVLLNDAMIWFESMNLETREGVAAAKRTKETALYAIKPVVKEMYERGMPIA